MFPAKGPKSTVITMNKILTVAAACAALTGGVAAAQDFKAGEVLLRALGAGVNYTRFSSVNVLGGAATVDRNSWGLAFQAGVDIPLAKNMYLNIDLKKVRIKTDVSAGGAKAGTFKVDPLLLGVGIGWKF